MLDKGINIDIGAGLVHTPGLYKFLDQNWGYQDHAQYIMSVFFLTDFKDHIRFTQMLLDMFPVLMHD